MVEGRRSRVTVVVAVAQLAVAAFFLADYLDDREHLAIVTILTVLLVGSAISLFLRLSWALPVSVAVNWVLIGLFWLGASNRQTSRAFLLAAAFSLPGVLLTAHWLRQRARAKREAPPQDPEADEDGGWTKEWAGGRVMFGFLLLFGFLSSAAGVAMAVDGSVATGAGMLGFGVSMLGASPLFRGWDRRGSVVSRPIAERGGEMGLVFPYSRTKMVGAVVGAGGMAVCCGAFAFGAFRKGPENERELIVFGVFGFVVMAGMALVQIRRNGLRAGYISLLEGGILATVGSAKSFVPWDAISRVDDVEMRMYVRGASAHEPFIGLMLSDPERVEMSWVARRLIPLNRRLAADIAYPTRGLDVDPHMVLEAIRYYFENPSARAELRTGSSRFEPARAPM